MSYRSGLKIQLSKRGRFTIHVHLSSLAHCHSCSVFVCSIRNLVVGSAEDPRVRQNPLAVIQPTAPAAAKLAFAKHRAERNTGLTGEAKNVPDVSNRKSLSMAAMSQKFTLGSTIMRSGRGSGSQAQFGPIPTQAHAALAAARSPYHSGVSRVFGGQPPVTAAASEDKEAFSWMTNPLERRSDGKQPEELPAAP